MNLTELKQWFSLRPFKRYPTLEQIEREAKITKLPDYTKCHQCGHLMSDHYMPPGTGSDVVEYCRAEDEKGNRICNCFRMY